MQMFGSSLEIVGKPPQSMSVPHSTGTHNSTFSLLNHELSNRTSTVGEGWRNQFTLVAAGYIEALGFSLKSGSGGIKIVVDGVDVLVYENIVTSTAWEAGAKIIQLGNPLPFSSSLVIYTKKQTGSDDTVQLIYRKRLV
jgi:hypothetical protein